MNIIDLKGTTSIEELHERIKEVMCLSDLYGENLDAFNDVLTETKGQIIIEGSEAVDEDMTEYVDRLKQVCFDAQENNPLLQIIFL